MNQETEHAHARCPPQDKLAGAQAKSYVVVDDLARLRLRPDLGAPHHAVGETRTWSKGSETSTQPPETPETARLRGLSTESSVSSPSGEEGPAHVALPPSLRSPWVDGKQPPPLIQSRLLSRRQRKQQEESRSVLPALSIDLSRVPRATVRRAQAAAARADSKGPVRGLAAIFLDPLRACAHLRIPEYADAERRKREPAAKLRSPISTCVQALAHAACYVCADELVTV